jgi:hypothetical protein
MEEMKRDKHNIRFAEVREELDRAEDNEVIASITGVKMLRNLDTEEFSNVHMIVAVEETKMTEKQILGEGNGEVNGYMELRESQRKDDQKANGTRRGLDSKSSKQIK